MRYLTRGDIILVSVLLVISLGSTAAVRMLPGGGKHAVVEVDGRRVLELSLGRNVEETVNGPLGETIIRVGNGSVEVVSSACPNKTCIHMGAISHRGEVVVCAPNRVFIYIRGGDGDETFDGVTQ